MKKYKAFFKSGMMEVFAYRFAIYSWFISSLGSLLCIFFLWLAIYKSSPDSVINGFTFKQIISYMIITSVFSTSVTGGQTASVISEEIRNGQIAMSLIKPISYRKRFFFSNIGNLVGANILIGFPILTIALGFLIGFNYIVVTSIPLFILNLCIYLLMQVLSSILYDGLDYIFGCITFYTLASFGLFQIKWTIVNFLSGSLIPLSFFPPWAENVLNYLPFASMVQNPVKVLLGMTSLTDSLWQIGLQLIWIVVYEVIAYFFFKKSIKKVTVQGG